MKLRFNPKSCQAFFSHERSGSEIIVSAMPRSVLITFTDENHRTATLEISTKEELERLKASLVNLKENSHKEIRGFFDGDVVFNVGYDNYGDPYEECVKFTFSIADSNMRWDEQEISASLDLYSEDKFISAISVAL